MDGGNVQIPLLVKPPGFGARHKQAIMTFFCLLFSYSLRVNLSMAIVAMTASSDQSDIPVLSWDGAMKGIILSSLFWGYVLPQIPAGEISRKYGSKYPLFICILFCSMATLLSPFIALNFSWIVFCLNRLAIGVAQGFVFPCIHAHTAQWAPPQERGRIITFVYNGCQVGIMVTMFVAGYLAASPWGWPSIFYSTGLCGVLWAAVWLFVGADSPESHPSISDSERDYIKSSLINNSENYKSMTSPWKALLTSGPLWALTLCHFFNNWGYWTAVTLLPSYFSYALHFNIKDNGLVSALPYLVKCILTVVFGVINDAIVEKQLISYSVARKLWNTIGMWGGALFFVALEFTSGSMSVVILTLAVSCSAAIYSGFMPNHMDLAPNFAGLLMGITNGFANLSAIMAPIAAGFIVRDQESKEEWMILFYISAAFYFAGNLIFLVFGTTEVQAWNNIKQSKIEEQNVSD